MTARVTPGNAAASSGRGIDESPKPGKSSATTVCARASAGITSFQV